MTTDFKENNTWEHKGKVEIRKIIICLVINPRQIFDVVAPLNKIKGIKIREKIRERVETYNGFPAPKELGFFGDKNNLEWKQYQLYEQGGLENTKCPLNIHSVNQGAKND